MSLIPANTCTQVDIDAWVQAKDALGKAKSMEGLLRKRLLDFFFPGERKEGTNTCPLPTEAKLKATCPIERKVLEEQMQAMATRPAPDQLSPLEKAGINLTNLIRWKPELSITHYRELTAEQRHLVDQMLEIKPGSASLEYVVPKPKA